MTSNWYIKDSGSTLVDFQFDPSRIIPIKKQKKKVVVAPGMPAVVIELGVYPKTISIRGIATAEEIRKIEDDIMENGTRPILAKLVDLDGTVLLNEDEIVIDSIKPTPFGHQWYEYTMEITVVGS